MTRIMMIAGGASVLALAYTANAVGDSYSLNVTGTVQGFCNVYSFTGGADNADVSGGNAKTVLFHPDAFARL